MKGHVLIGGGSGLVGKLLTEQLKSSGYEVAWLSRSAKPSRSTLVFHWEPATQTIDQKAIEWADYVINLAGAGVADKRWNASWKKAIYSSRIDTTETLIQAFTKYPNHNVKAFVSASAIGIYGFKTSDEILHENSPANDDFLANVVKDWEKSANRAINLGIRTSTVRIGIVLSREGGALVEMSKPPVLAPLGTGHQWMNWIHIDDVCGIFQHILENEALAGAYNAAAPNPTRNSLFTRELAKAAGKPFLPIGVPHLMLRLIVGEMSQILTGGQPVSVDKINDTYTFKFGKLETALNQLFG